MLKRTLDHQIQIISPFFTTIDGEVHHQPRYSRYPNVLAAGWMNAPDAPREAIFRHLAYRNALNMHAPASASGVAYAGQSDDELAGAAEGWLADLEREPRPPKPVLPRVNVSTVAGAPVRRAVLLVGSPRCKTSTSASLGGYVLAQLESHGVQTEIIHLYTTLNRSDRLGAMLDSVDGADLMVLAFPLYVDSLPAPVVEALERIAAHRAGARTSARFAAITNCGFPEAAHCETALATCAAFAEQAGFAWTGGLALGGGEGLVHGTPLDQLGQRAASIRKALEIAADALAAGTAIPPDAVALLARPMIPAWLYRLIGGFGWTRQARRYGAQHHLKARPYDGSRLQGQRG